MEKSRPEELAGKVNITEERKRSLMAICCIKEPSYLHYDIVVDNKKREMKREVLL